MRTVGGEVPDKTTFKIMEVLLASNQVEASDSLAIKDKLNHSQGNSFPERTGNEMAKKHILTEQTSKIGLKNYPSKGTSKFNWIKLKNNLCPRAL